MKILAESRDMRNGSRACAGMFIIGRSGQSIRKQFLKTNYFGVRTSNSLSNSEINSLVGRRRLKTVDLVVNPAPSPYWLCRTSAGDELQNDAGVYTTDHPSPFVYQ